MKTLCPQSSVFFKDSPWKNCMKKLRNSWWRHYFIVETFRPVGNTCCASSIKPSQVLFYWLVWIDYKLVPVANFFFNEYPFYYAKETSISQNANAECVCVWGGGVLHCSFIFGNFLIKGTLCFPLKIYLLEADSISSCLRPTLRTRAEQKK
jgi:hypothetical protein